MRLIPRRIPPSAVCRAPRPRRHAVLTFVLVNLAGQAGDDWHVAVIVVARGEQLLGDVERTLLGHALDTPLRGVACQLLSRGVSGADGEREGNQRGASKLHYT